MTICIATSNFPPQTGGIATFYGHLADLLAKEGHRVIVLMPDENPGEDLATTKDSLTIILLRKKYQTYLVEYKHCFRAGGLNAASWIAAGYAMRDWLHDNSKEYNIDLIEASDYGGLGIFMLSPSLPPVGITGHGTFTQLSRYNHINEDSQTTVVKKLELLSLQKADGVIVHSPLNKADMEQLSGRNIHFATAPWQPAKKENRAIDNDVVFVAGGLQEVKGAEIMAEASAICAKQDPAFRLYWAGGDTFTAPGGGSMSVYLKKKYPEIWNKHFIWLNELSKESTQEKIAEAGIVAIPSQWESFNYVALEAAALQKAVIMTESTGAAYLFQHGTSAWIIPPNNAAELARAIFTIRQDASLQEKMGFNAAAMAANTFDSTSLVKERMAIYATIIEQRAANRKDGREYISFLKKYQKPGRKFMIKLVTTIKHFLLRK